MNRDGQAQQAAIQNRLRELFEQQFELFRKCLDVLEKQQTVIESANWENILTYTEIEEQITAEIFSIQKVIDPLENSYHADSEEAAICALKAAIENLKNRTAAQSRHNISLLADRISDTRVKMEVLKSSSLAIGVRRPLFQDAGAASLVDIEG